MAKPHIVNRVVGTRKMTMRFQGKMKNFKLQKVVLRKNTFSEKENVKEHSLCCP